MTLWGSGFGLLMGHFCQILTELSARYVIAAILSFLVIPRHKIVVGYYGITLAVLVSVRPSIFSFLNDNLSKCQWIFTKL